MTGQGRWSDALLDDMRGRGDPLADDAVAAVFAAGQLERVQRLMNTLVANDDPPPDDLPSELRSYLEAVAAAPPCEVPRVVEGERLFAAHGPEILLILACYSLPMDYAGRRGVRVLYETGYLAQRPNRRLVETAQMVVDVMSPGGLGPSGRGVRTVQKVRLMHAAIRHLILHDEVRPWDAGLGVPINQEDLAGTLLSFSTVVLDGLDKLAIRVSPAAQNAYFDAWRAIGRLMGVRNELVPADLGESRELLALISRRQQGESKEGRLMTAALLAMLDANATPGFENAPAALMRHFLPPAIADALAVPVHRLDECLVAAGAALAAELGPVMDAFGRHDAVLRGFGLRFVDWLIEVDRGGQRARFAIPTSLTDGWRRWPEGGEETFWPRLVAWLRRPRER